MSSQYSKRQKDLIKQLQQFTGASFSQAAEKLQAHSWKLDIAADSMFRDGGDSYESDTEPFDTARVEAWFNEYADTEHKDKMLADGIAKFCEDIGVDPEDVVMLVLSEYMVAANLLEYSKEEFVRGMQSIRAESKQQLKEKIPLLRNELQRDDRFKEVYLFTYGFAKQRGQKSMAVDIAIALWKLLLQDRFHFVSEWCDFVEKHRTHAITKDEWTLLLEFVTKVNGDLSKYEEDGAWPVIIDDFVEEMKKKAKSS